MGEWPAAEARIAGDCLMGFLEDWWNAKRTINPVALAWQSLPPEAKASYSSIPGLLGELSPGASVRDAVEASGQIGHGLLNADPKQAALGAAGMGAAILGLLPFGRSGKIFQKAMQETAKEAAPVVQQAAKEFTPIRAYHGSPHSFDAFDLSKIGTGEGAQSYGHGMYLAENEKVAKAYRDALSAPKGNSWKDVAGKVWQATGGDRDRTIAELQSRVDSLVRRRLENPASVPPEMMTAGSSPLETALEQMKSGHKPGGHMYEVQVNADPAKFLDWDKPLAQQTPEVQAALNFQPTLTGMGGGPKMYSDKLGTYARETDAPIHRAMDLRSPAAAKALNDAGIPGIRYLDQGSRGAGDGSRNIVVFDPATIEILRKYGLLPAVGAAAVAPGLLSPAEGQVQ